MWGRHRTKNRKELTNIRNEKKSDCFKQLWKTGKGKTLTFWNGIDEMLKLSFCVDVSDRHSGLLSYFKYQLFCSCRAYISNVTVIIHVFQQEKGGNHSWF